MLARQAGKIRVVDNDNLPAIGELDIELEGNAKRYRSPECRQGVLWMSSLIPQTSVGYRTADEPLALHGFPLNCHLR